jgi:DivIVA domain-containing protein
MPEFPVVMPGYKRREVDELFARIDATLGHGPTPAKPVTAADVNAIRFHTQMRGYSPSDADSAVNAALNLG